ncbi:apolipoprotein N-acyltransferase [Sulfurivermis fontis]|uniref:apolipoprotein N-acyltransferase n=1 Tax=Sulfurivermis fontis TaxID=1972068 RepID=UPI0018D5A037|nr:apolipoprotein N-acyltransferase [Sulfurivermis fontis]
MFLPLAFAPFGWFPLAVLSPALLFFSLYALSPRTALRRGFLFGLGLFGVGVSWVYVAIADFSDSGAVTAVILTALFVAALAAYPALFAYVAARWWRRGALPLALWYLAALPALWMGFEWLRGWLFTGFTWLQLGYSQTQSPLAGLAPLFGVYGVGLVLAVSAGALAWLLHSGRRAWPGVALAMCLWLAGWGAQQIEWTRPVGEPLRMALIQDNLPQATKWDPAQFNARLELYARLTLENLGAVDAVIWPENAVTVFYHELKDDYFDWLAAQARGQGTDIVVGVPVKRRDAPGYYTSLMVLGAQEAAYHKHHLVPFGEFVPLEGLLRGLISFFDLPMSGFSSGPAAQPPLPVAGQRAAMSICYEDAFGEELLHNFPAATLLINGSNNAWYGDSLAPHQHLEIARMRAVESGRPLVRATTTGISALVDHRGRLLAIAPQFVEYVLRGSVQPMQGMTPYARWGNWPVLLLLLLLAGVNIVVQRRGQVISS